MKIPFQNLFKKKDESDAPVPQPDQTNTNKGKNNFFDKLKLKFGSGLKSRLGEISGVSNFRLGCICPSSRKSNLGRCLARPGPPPENWLRVGG